MLCVRCKGDPGKNGAEKSVHKDGTWKRMKRDGLYIIYNYDSNVS